VKAHYLSFPTLYFVLNTLTRRVSATMLEIGCPSDLQALVACSGVVEVQKIQKIQKLQFPEFPASCTVVWAISGKIKVFVILLRLFMWNIDDANVVTSAKMQLSPIAQICANVLIMLLVDGILTHFTDNCCLTHLIPGRLDGHVKLFYVFEVFSITECTNQFFYMII